MIKNEFKLNLILLFVILLLSAKTQAQTEDEQLQILEKQIENSDLATDFNELDEYLNSGKNQKLNINTASPFQLYSLGILNQIQIKEIINHRKIYGDFISINELQTLDSMPVEIINKLKYRITFGNSSEKIILKNAYKNSEKSIYFLTKYSSPLSIAYVDSSLGEKYLFRGSPVLNRIKFKSNLNNRIIAGISAEKDAGEEFFSGLNKKGYDFYSGYILLNFNSKIKRIIIGDYKADYGQGLVMSGGINTGKNSLITNIKRLNSGLRPYTSFNENGFLRGSALKININKIDISLMISAKKTDAVLDTLMTTSDELIFIKSIDESGYHRSQSEFSYKNKNTELLFGQNINYSNKNYSFGITALYLNNKYESEPNNKLYAKYNFTSKEFLKTGINWDYYYKNINIFGESAICSNKSSGTICGANISLGNFADISTIYRNFSRSFIWNYTNAFSENTNPVNENGLYTGILIFPNNKLHFSAFLDRYTNPWYSYYTDGESHGNDILLETKYEPDKKSMIYFRIRRKCELKNNDEGYYNYLNYDNKLSFRIHVQNAISRNTLMKFRFEFSKYKTPSGNYSKGNLIFADFVFNKNRFPVSFNSRITIFNIDDYSTRIYALENDLLYTWSVPAFYDSGIKFYILVKFKFKKIIAQYKFSILKYYNKTTIGSGNTEIKSDRINENGLIFHYTFN